MDILVLDSNFNVIAVLDSYYSLIWSVRYCDLGDFELYLPVSGALPDYIKKEHYLYSKDSDRIMIIEEFGVDASSEGGLFITITGRSLESILTRRIVWNHTVVSGDLQPAIQKLIDDNIINPVDPSRKISNFIFVPSTDPEITSLTVDAQFHGEDLYEVIKELCTNAKLGFKITLSDNNDLMFSLFKGVDRSYRQTLNPYVIFSNKFENLQSSSYLESRKNHKTITLIGGEGEAQNRKLTTLSVESGPGIELTRREIFTDASGVSASSSEGTIPESVYLDHLREKGLETLNNNKALIVFDGLSDVEKTFVYGKDFDIGDMVQLRNEYGFEAESRITELIFTHDSTGHNTFPTFVVED